MELTSLSQKCCKTKIYRTTKYETSLTTIENHDQVTVASLSYFFSKEIDLQWLICHSKLSTTQRITMELQISGQIKELWVAVGSYLQLLSAH